MRAVYGLILSVLVFSSAAPAHDGNRLTYLDEYCDPYYVGRQFARLTTPQWIGQAGVEAAVVLAIDDMRDPARYEQYLRPILDRLNQYHGRSPLSIMTCQVSADHPQLAPWIKAGVTLEVHTVDHPCPLLCDGDLARAKSTFDRCIDLLHTIDGNRPVAFRMPCCDSLNTPSPRFYSEIFNRVTPNGNFLAIDSSVFNVLTPEDPSLPRDLVLDQDRPRFRKYLPFPSFVNTIDDYPYPYVIGRLCWEFPCAVPSDWEAQNLHQVNNPQTVADWQYVVDATVIKQGVMNLVFHPHGWIRNDQIVQLIDHCVRTHGDRVTFLSFGDALARLEKNLLDGQPLRSASGEDNGVRLVDLNADGYLDVVIGNDHLQRTRLWSPAENRWVEGDFPTRIAQVNTAGDSIDLGVRFAVLRGDGSASMIVRNRTITGAWHFDGGKWLADPRLLQGLELDGQPIMTSIDGLDQGVRFRDLDGDGCCECLVSNARKQAAFQWNVEAERWSRLPFALPAKTTIVDPQGGDAGLRFIDLDQDGYRDVVFSNDQHCGLWLFASMKTGWDRPLIDADRSDQPAPLPPIVSGGTNFGAWFHSGHMWVQNEHTNRLPDLVDRRSYQALLAKPRQ